MNKLNGNHFIADLLATASPPDLLSHPEALEYYIIKYLCIHQISEQRHVQVTAKGSTQLFLISHPINECFYLNAVYS